MKGLPNDLMRLMAQDHWVIWRYEEDASGRKRKAPYQAKHPTQYAKSNDPKTWASYEEALAAAPDDGGGIGFMLLDSGVAALDLDDCRDRDTGALDAWARDLIAKADGAYVEVTPSGRGLRVIGRSKGEPAQTIRRRGEGKVEIYRNTARYICVTGKRLK